MAKVRICKKCSGVDIEPVKGFVGEEGVSKGCIGKCLHRSAELKGTCYGYIDGKFEITLSQKEFMEKIKKAQETSKI